MIDIRFRKCNMVWVFLVRCIIDPRLRTLESLETFIQTLVEEPYILPALEKFNTSDS